MEAISVLRNKALDFGTVQISGRSKSNDLLLHILGKNIVSMGGKASKAKYDPEPIYKNLESSDCCVAYYVNLKRDYEDYTKTFESNSRPQHDLKFYNPNSRNDLQVVFTWLGKEDCYVVESSRNSSPLSKRFDTVQQEFGRKINEDYEMKGFQYEADPYCCGIGLLVRTKDPSEIKNLAGLEEALYSYIDSEGDHIGLAILDVQNDPKLVKAAIDSNKYSWFGTSDYTKGILYIRLGGCDDDDSEYYDDDDE